MYVSPLDLEWVVPEAPKPRVVERFFIQRRRGGVWKDAYPLDVNANGLTSCDQALQYLDHLEKSEHFPPDPGEEKAELRIIVRVFTMEASVVGQNGWGSTSSVKG